MTVDYVGIVKTNGARMLGFTLSLLPYNADNSLMVIGIIDAKTGNVLWTNMSMDQKIFIRVLWILFLHRKMLIHKE